MSATIERMDSNEALRRTAEITLAALLHDIGKVFQRADWQLSQAAERMQEALCPVVEGRPVHRHILWTYDFCNDNLKWLADHVDLARVIRLATGHHRAAVDDPAALILDAADRLAAGRDDIEIEELQPAIPPQVPIESVLWAIAGRAVAAGQAGPADKPKSRRVRRSRTSQEEAAAAGTVAEPSSPPADGSSPEQIDSPPAAAREGVPEEAGSSAPVPARYGYVKAQLLRPDEAVLPTPERPEMSEQDYRAIGAELVAIFQNIGRMTDRPRIEWLIETMRVALQGRVSLVPEYIGTGGQTVSLYSQAAATAAVAAALWQWHEKTGGLPAAEETALGLVNIQIEGANAFLRRPCGGAGGSRVYRGRAGLACLTVRLFGDMLLRELGLSSANRLWEGDDGLAILVDGSDATAAVIERFAREQGRLLFEQSGGYLRLVVAEPVRFSTDALRGGWGGLAKAAAANLNAARNRPAAAFLQDDGGWLEEAALPRLQSRHGQAQDPAEWAHLAEAYERQLGAGLARGRIIAAYNSPVTPAGSEGEPIAIGPWFVHVGVSAEGLADREALEQAYAIGETDEAWAWVPPWDGLPHGPTLRRADESQLRADPMPSRPALDAARRREAPIDFAELGWLARRSRKGRGFVGRSWLGCLVVEADGLKENWNGLPGQGRTLGEAIEAARQGQWFWQAFLEGQLRRADRATWRVFALRCGLATATLIGPWNTLMVLAGRIEQWWRRWIGSAAAWPLRGALCFAPRDVPVADLIRQTEAGLAEAEPLAGAGRVWVFEQARTWAAYREALRLGHLLDEQIQSPGLRAAESGLVFCRRLLDHAGRAPAADAGPALGHRRDLAWRSQLSQDVRKLLLEHMPRRGQRTAGQEELLQQVQDFLARGRRGRLPAGVGIAARMVLWQNQGETS